MADFPTTGLTANITTFTDDSGVEWVWDGDGWGNKGTGVDSSSQTSAVMGLTAKNNGTSGYPFGTLTIIDDWTIILNEFVTSTFINGVFTVGAGEGDQWYDLACSAFTGDAAASNNASILELHVNGVPIFAGAGGGPSFNTHGSGANVGTSYKLNDGDEVTCLIDGPSSYPTQTLGPTYGHLSITTKGI